MDGLMLIFGLGNLLIMVQSSLERVGGKFGILLLIIRPFKKIRRNYSHFSFLY